MLAPKVTCLLCLWNERSFMFVSHENPFASTR